MAVKSLIKINVNDSNDVFLVCDYKPAEKILITLLDSAKCKAYTGRTTDIEMRSQAATISMTFSDFESLTKRALLQNELDGDKFLYSLENNSTGFIFKWKSVDKYETVISIGNLKVTEDDYETVIKNVFSALSEEMINLNRTVINIQRKLTETIREKEDALQLLSDASSIKDRIEKELFSKFILVLNEKKEEIRKLKQNSYKGKPNLPKNKICKKKRSTVVHAISESSDETNSDVGKMDDAVPSTSKRNCSLLFLDDDEESEQLKISPSKRRMRNNIAVNNNKDQEKSKLDLKDAVIESESEDELFKIL